jgi:hypothetical protein
VRIASVDDKLFIHHEPLEQQYTRALGERSGTKVHLVKVARIRYSVRRLFPVVLWCLNTAPSVIITRPTVTKISARVLFAWRLCHSYQPRIEQEQGIVFVLSMYLPFLQITEFLQIRVNRPNNRVSLEPRVSYNDGESLRDRSRTCLWSGRNETGRRQKQRKDLNWRVA